MLGRRKLCAPTRRKEMFQNEAYQELSITARHADHLFEVVRGGFRFEMSRKTIVEGMERNVCIQALNVPTASSQVLIMVYKGDRCLKKRDK